MLPQSSFSWKLADQKHRSKDTNYVYVWLNKTEVSMQRTVKDKKLVPIGTHCFIGYRLNDVLGHVVALNCLKM